MPSDVQRVRDVCEVDVGLFTQMTGEALGIAIERLAVARGERQQLQSASRCRSLLLRRLRKHDMGVRAPYAEGVDRRDTRAVFDRPIPERVVDDERRLVQLDIGIGRRVVEACGQLFVMHGQRGLDQACNPGRRVQVSDVRFDGADATEAHPLRLGPKGLRQRRQLDRIPHVRAGAVALDVPDLVRRDSSHRVRFRHRLSLAVDARCEVADFRAAIIVDRGAADDGIDAVTIFDRVRQPTQSHDSRSAAKDGASRLSIERPAVSVWREHLAFVMHVAATMWDLDRDAACKRHVALTAQQALARHVGCHQGGRAGCLDADRRPLEVQ